MHCKQPLRQPGNFSQSFSYYLLPQALPMYLSVFEPPEPPTSVYITEVTSRSVGLAWYPAFDGNSPVISYLLQHRVGRVYCLVICISLFQTGSSSWSNLTVHGSLSSALVSGLQPFTDYKLQVSPCWSPSCSPGHQSSAPPCID